MKVTICADPKNGNDWQSVEAELPTLPRAGDAFEVLVPTGVTVLEVEGVTFGAILEEAPSVWVRLDGYRLEDLDEAVASIRTGYAAGTNDNAGAVTAAMRWKDDEA